jgi:hypothetical protein
VLQWLFLLRAVAAVAALLRGRIVEIDAVLRHPRRAIEAAGASGGGMTKRGFPIGAILFAVRDRGLGALKEPLNAARLARLDPDDREEFNEEIRRIFGELREEPQSLRKRRNPGS